MFNNIFFYINLFIKDSNRKDPLVTEDSKFN